MNKKFFILIIFFYQILEGTFQNKFNSKNLLKNIKKIDENKKEIIIQSLLIFAYDALYIKNILKKNLLKKSFLDRSMFSITAITTPYLLSVGSLYLIKKNKNKNIFLTNIAISTIPFFTFISIFKEQN